MSVKVRIDLVAGTLEAEGSEEFIRELYKDFRERVGQPPVTSRPPAPKTDSRSEGDASEPKNPKRSGAERKGNTARKDRTPVLVKDLDLATKGNRIGLKDFAKRYTKLTSSMDLNALFVYYLSREAEVDPITIDHVYTCYKHVGARVPGALPQSLWDTARKKGTIDTASLDDIKLTTVGENWVEHDLAKALPE